MSVVPPFSFFLSRHAIFVGGCSLEISPLKTYPTWLILPKFDSKAHDRRDPYRSAYLDQCWKWGSECLAPLPDLSWFCRSKHEMHFSVVIKTSEVLFLGGFLIIVKKHNIFGFFNVLSSFLNVSAHFEVIFRPLAGKSFTKQWGILNEVDS